MYFSSYVVAAVLAAAPSSVNCHVARHGPSGVAYPTGTYGNSTVWITQTVTAYQTYCPTSTKFEKGTRTYTATAQTWVTVTDCPQMCTISNKAGARPTVAPIGQTPVWNNATSVAATKPTPAPCPCKTALPLNNGTSPSCPCHSFGSSGSTGSSTSSPNSPGSTGPSVSTGCTGSASSTGSTGSAGSSSSSGYSGSSGPSGVATSGPSIQTTSAGEKVTASLSGLAVVAITFFAL